MTFSCSVRSSLIRSNSVDSGTGSLGPTRRGSAEKLVMPPGWAANLDPGSLAAVAPGRGRVARQLEPELTRVSGPTAGTPVPGHSTDSSSRGSTARQPVADPSSSALSPAAAQGGPGFGPAGQHRGVSRQSEPTVNRLLRTGSPVVKAPQQESVLEQADVGHTASAPRGTSGSQVRARVWSH